MGPQHRTVDLGTLNAAAADAALLDLMACCASERWATEMSAHRPFATPEVLLTAASDIWWTLDEEDWLQAFAAHPRIGEERSGDDRHSTWSRTEQATTTTASDHLREELAACNREYEARFGHVYLVFASGKTADELLAVCRERIANDPEEELLVAAEEQMKITEARLRQLVGID